MKKILLIVAGFAVIHIGFAQATLTAGKNVSTNSTGKQAKLSYPHTQVKGNADYMKGRGPVANQKKAVAPKAQSNTRPAAATVSAEPKQASVASQQQAKLSNDQRLTNLNTRIAQNKAQEDANKANSVRPVSSSTPKANTLKKPVGLKSAPTTNTTTTKQLPNK